MNTGKKHGPACDILSKWACMCVCVCASASGGEMKKKTKIQTRWLITWWRWRCWWREREALDVLWCLLEFALAERTVVTLDRCIVCFLGIKWFFSWWCALKQGYCRAATRQNSLQKDGVFFTRGMELRHDNHLKNSMSKPTNLDLKKVNTTCVTIQQLHGWLIITTKNILG